MARNDDLYKIGDKVLLRLDFEALRYAPKGLARWDGCTFRIEKVKTMKGKAYYELKGCRSVEGVNYAISEDWLILMRDLYER